MMDSGKIQKMESVISLMKKKTGINIQNFKLTFLERRINHRMCDLGILDFDKYVDLLSTSVNESENLYNSFSINVTKFFRDPSVWKTFEHQILPNFYNDSNFSSIDLWSCGSATGEEVYSISILLDKHLKKKHMKYNIIGTDINEKAILTAKQGIYKKEKISNVNSHELQTYFDVLPDEHYKIKSEFKKNIQLERLDLLQTTGKYFDIIFCRNVLIYYDRRAHEILFKKFFSLLKKDGILILGQDESMIGTNGKNYFNLLYPRERIYQKKEF